MACGSVAHADDGVARAVLRRCAPVELRHLRGAGSRRSCSISTTSTRRCRRRSSGTSSAWWRASSSPRVATAIVARSSGGGARRRRGLPDDDGQGGDDALPGCLVHAVRRRQGDRGAHSRRVDKAAVKAAKKALAKAQTRTSLGSLEKFAERVDGGYRIKQQPPVIVRPPETMSDDFEQIIHQGLADYASSLAPDRRVVLDHYHYEDFARKVVGVGSVGTEAMMILLMGDREDDPLFLQIKEATTSVLAPYAGASEYDAPGRAGRARPAAHASRKRRLPGLVHRHRRRPSRVLCPPTARQEGLGRGRDDDAREPGDLRRALRRHAGPRARTHRRRGEDHRLPRRRRHVRPRPRTLRRRLRRPERRRLRRVHRGRRQRRRIEVERGV